MNNTSIIQSIFAERYRVLKKIGEGYHSEVYLAENIKKKHKAAIKVLNKKIISNRIEDIIRFYKEADTISRLDHKRVLKIYEVGEYDNQHYIISEYVKGITLKEYINVNPVIPIKTCIHIFQQLADVLEFVHNKKIIHRDLKPGNVIISGDTINDIHIKILDFGISQILDLTLLKDKKQIAGTFSYMSPEQSGIIKKTIDERSDLYSLGIIFYQLLTGELPFKGEDIGTILHEQIAKNPESIIKKRDDVPEIIEKIVFKLLAKDPDNRYQTASGLEKDLQKFLKGDKFILGKEDRSRKITYQTKIAGRDKELGDIEQLYERAKKGEGSVCLISGPPGIGKSRLVNEIIAYVYKKRGNVIAGKCFDTKHKIPYQPFREALNEYIENTEKLSFFERDVKLKKIQENAGELGEILCRFNPVIKEVLENIPVIEKLEDADKDNQRFISVCAKFILSLGEKNSPLVIFIDDLQWADEASLLLLREMLYNIEKTNVLILGTYRDNEVSEEHTLSAIKNSGLDKNLSLVEIFLMNLYKADIQRMLAQLIQEDAGDIIYLANYIHRKSSGNPMFALELIRQMVTVKVMQNIKNQWEIDLTKLEHIIVPDTILEILLVRLNSLDKEYWELLSIAAIIGKTFTIDLLIKLSTLKEGEVIRIIDEITAMNLLEKGYMKGEVIFAHDRIREAVYSKIDDKRQKEIHLSIAEMLEDTKADQGETIIFDLANHYIMAGNNDKSLQYALPAAWKAKEQYANIDGIRYFKIASQIMEDKGLSGTSEWISAREGLADIYITIGESEKGIELLKGIIFYKNTILEKARIFNSIGKAYFNEGKYTQYISEKDLPEFILNNKKLKNNIFKKGISNKLVLKINRPEQINNRIKKSINKIQLKEIGNIIIKIKQNNSEYYYLEGLKLLNEKMPQRELTISLIFVKELFLHLLINLVPWIFKHRKKSKIKEEDKEIVKIYTNLIWTYSYNDMKKSLISCLRMYWKDKTKVDLPIRESIISKFAYASGIGCIPLFKPATKIFKKTLEITRKSGKQPELSNGLLLLGFNYIAQGKYENSIIECNESKGICERTGDYWSLTLNLLILIIDYIRLGKYNKALDFAFQKLEIANKINADHTICTAYGVLSEIYYHTGDFIYAEENGEKALLIGIKHNNLFLMCLANTRLGYLEFYRQDYDKAINYFLNSKKIYETNILIKSDVLDFIPGLIRAYIKQYLKILHELSKTEKRKQLKRIKSLSIHALRICKPWPHHYGLSLSVRAQYLSLVNKNKKAEKLFKKCINKFKELKSPFHIAEAYYEYAVFLEKCKRKEAEDHYKNAYVIFKDIGAKHYIEKLSSILKTTDSKTSIEQFEKIIDKERLSSIIQVSRSISNILDFEILLQEIMSQVIIITGAQNGYLFLKDEQSNELELKTKVNTDEKEISQYSKSIVNKVFQSEKTILTTDAEEDKEFSKSKSIIRYGMKSILCIPIKYKKKFIGICYIDNNIQKGVFTEEDITLLEAVMTQASICIENARAHEDLKIRKRKLEVNGRRIKDENLKLRSMVSIGEQKIEPVGNLSIITQNRKIKQIINEASSMANSKACLMITGESGVGKEMFAQLIHQKGCRRDKPFIKINCSAIPGSLFESEFFGHTKGAFTGAIKDKKGKFELADKGTLFLDEVGDLPLSQQAKLLRVIEEEEVVKIGDQKPVKIDVRVISATNKDLTDMIKNSRFREDLFFRLNILRLHIPPLRERKEDIIILGDYFINRTANEEGLPEKYFTDEALKYIFNLKFPGNIRELKNLIYKLYYSTQNELISVEDIKKVHEENLDNMIRENIETDNKYETLFKNTMAFHDFKNRIESEYLKIQLQKYNNNLSQTAKALGLQSSNLSRKLKSMNIRI